MAFNLGPFVEPYGVYPEDNEIIDAEYDALEGLLLMNTVTSTRVPVHQDEVFIPGKK